VVYLWSSDGHPAAIVAGEGDVRGSERGLSTEVWFNRLVSAGKSVCVGGGRLMRLLVIGSHNILLSVIVLQVLCGWAHSLEVECLRNQGARQHDLMY
jgi:hypothetical protein